MYKLLDIIAGSLAGKSLFETGEFEGLGVALTEMERSKKGTGSHHIIFSGQTKYELLTSISRIVGENGKSLGWVLVFRDITHQKRVENMKDEFISIISHEIRTPLTVISSYVSMLAEDLPQEILEENKPIFEEIEQANIRLTRIISELIEMSEVDKEAPPAKRRKVSLSKLIKEAIAKVKANAAESSVEVLSQLPDRRIQLRCRPEQIENAVYQLLLNGINFSYQGGKVVCTLEETKTRILIKVRDHGQGIPAKEIPRIFSKFYQIENHMTRTVGGLGLGLPLVKQIVNNHGGKISVKSTPGKGSQFTVTFPKAPTEADILEEQVERLQKRLASSHKQSIAYARDIGKLLKKGKE